MTSIGDKFKMMDAIIRKRASEKVYEQYEADRLQGEILHCLRYRRENGEDAWQQLKAAMIKHRGREAVDNLCAQINSYIDRGKR